MCFQTESRTQQMQEMLFCEASLFKSIYIPQEEEATEVFSQ